MGRWVFKLLLSCFSIVDIPPLFHPPSLPLSSFLNYLITHTNCINPSSLLFILLDDFSFFSLFCFFSLLSNDSPSH